MPYHFLGHPSSYKLNYTTAGHVRSHARYVANVVYTDLLVFLLHYGDYQRVYSFNLIMSEGREVLLLHKSR